MSDIASGLFALGGTLIGGIASYLGTVSEARFRRADAKRDHDEKLAETRRQLYSTYLKCADAVLDEARNIISYATPGDIPDQDEAAYLAAWDSLVESRSAVEIVGPPSMAESANTLYRAVADVCNQADEWFAREAPWTESTDDERAKLLAVVKDKARPAFVTEAQRVVATT